MTNAELAADHAKQAEELLAEKPSQVKNPYAKAAGHATLAVYYQRGRETVASAVGRAQAARRRPPATSD